MELTFILLGLIRKKRKEGSRSFSFEIFYVWSVLGTGEQCVNVPFKNNGKNNMLKHVSSMERLEKQFSKYFNI